MSHSSIDWSFEPTKLLPGGHLQTVIGINWPHDYAPHAAKLHTVPTVDPVGRFDDEQIALHEDRPDNWESGEPIVLLIHGLAGCHESTYMRRTAEKLADRGYNTFRMDMRGCGAGEGIARLPAHCGRGEDVRAALEYLAEIYPESPVQVVGFSLGGTITLNMLGDHAMNGFAGQPIGNYQRGLAVCPPIDLFNVERRFDALGGRAYDRFFVKLLWKQIEKRWHLFPEEAPQPFPRRPRRLRTIDEMVVAPGGGFENADAYYAATQPGPKLKAIDQPITIIAAADDPVVPTKPLLDYEKSDAIETIVIPKGGHLGFVAKKGRDPDRRWLDWRIVDWVEAGKFVVPPSGGNQSQRNQSEKAAASV